MTPLMIGIAIIGVFSLVSINNLLNNFDELEETKKYIKTGEEIEYLSKKSEILKNNNIYYNLEDNMELVKYGKMSDILSYANMKDKEIIAINKLNNTIKKYIEAGYSENDFIINYNNDAEINDLWNKIKVNNYQYTKLNKEEFELALKTKYYFYEVNKYSVDVSNINNEFENNIKMNKLNDKIYNDTSFPIYNQNDEIGSTIKIAKNHLRNTKVGNDNIYNLNKKIFYLSEKINSVLSKTNSSYSEFYKALNYNSQLALLDPIYSKKLSSTLNQKMMNAKTIKTVEKVILMKLNEKSQFLYESEITNKMENDLKVAYIKDNYREYNENNKINKNDFRQIILNKKLSEEIEKINSNIEYSKFLDQIEIKKEDWNTEINEISNNDLKDLSIFSNEEEILAETDQYITVKNMITDFNIGDEKSTILEDDINCNDNNPDTTDLLVNGICQNTITNTNVTTQELYTKEIVNLNKY